MVDYADIPTLNRFKTDSSVFFSLRASDPVLSSVDTLLQRYEAAPESNQHEILYYLLLATRFWIAKRNRIPANADPEGFEVHVPGGTRLPNTRKLSAKEARADAITALRDVTNAKLRSLLGIDADEDLNRVLSDLYERPNLSLQGDTDFIERYRDHPDVTLVYIEQDGIRRKYKLRFRNGIAWRWYHPHRPHDGYVRFDTTDNAESEITDQRVHFAMTPQGRIYAGFDKQVVWFKHSSLTGGGNVLAAGRMRCVNGTIQEINNDSGHYQPGAREMVHVLQRLRLYGVSVSNITVRRMATTTWDAATFTGEEMLAGRPMWPDQR